MGIDKFIKRVCVQTAVYWGNPVNNGRGGKTFDYPIEIKCRWENKQRVHIDGQGKQFISTASILVTEDLQMEGWLFLGHLTDIPGYGESSLPEANPMNVKGAIEIIAFDSIPMIRSTTIFVRTAYLGFRNV